MAMRGKDPETQAARVGTCEHNRQPDLSGFQIVEQ